MLSNKKFKNQMLIMLAIAIFLLADVVLFVNLKGLAMNSILTYPPAVKCDSVNRLFEDDDETFLKYAEFDKQRTLDLEGAGIYQCYCKDTSGIMGIFGEKNFCSEYSYGQFYIALFSNGMTGAIAVVNIAVRLFNIYLIGLVGFDYESQRIRMTMQSILYAQYFNTGIILLLSNANFDNTPFNFIPIRQQFPDTSTVWYILFGPTIIKTMLFYAVFPYLNYLIFFGMRLFRRFLDSGTKSCFGKDKKTFVDTKLKTPQQYVELYSGPDVAMNFKYSNVMNIVMVAFTHGIAIPLLWWITLFGIFNNYLFERILFAYYYKQPPLFDEKLNAKALNILQACPVIMMLMGYWYLGNRQMFFNKFSPIEDASG